MISIQCCFGIGRAIGIGANLIWDRALLYLRRQSLTTHMLEEMVGISEKKKADKNAAERSK